MIGFYRRFVIASGLGDRPCDLGSMVQCLVVALAEITPPELKVLKGFCKHINEYFPNFRMLVVQIYDVSSIVWGGLLCFFRFFWRVWDFCHVEAS